MAKNIYWFEEIDKSSVRIAGGKAANLGEMTHVKGLPVPPGFVVSSESYFEFIRQKGIDAIIRKLTLELDVQNTALLQQVSNQIKQAIIAAEVPPELYADIVKAYNKLSGIELLPSSAQEVRVAVRSSATAEDLPQASFAGAQATFVNVKGGDEVVKAVKQCWASLFEARAIYYRQQQGFDNLKVGLAAIVEQMVDSDQSGVMFTIDPVTQDENALVIEAGLGLGESVVSGAITPDRYTIDKSAFQLVDKQIAHQTEMIVYAPAGGTRTVEVPEELQNTQKISDKQALDLAAYGLAIEKHYKAPQDIEWAISEGKIYIVQTRAITTLKPKAPATRPGAEVTTPLLKGLAASPGTAQGPVRIVLDPEEITKVQQGDILVAKMTSPDYVPAMKKAAAIITDAGGITAHAAIVSRELGIPAIVGTRDATMTLHDGQKIFVDAVRGEVYEEGKQPATASMPAPVMKPVFIPQPFEEAPARMTAPVRFTPYTHGRTKLYVNLAEPDAAARVAAKNVEGVGLFRAEFLIAQLGMHPLAAVKQGKSSEFIQLVAQGMRDMAKAFHPRPVYYRANDFKSNEYRNLKGGAEFEPEEENPMLGYRGCFRYIKDRTIFEMELEALKQVRKEFDNLHLMIPFVRNTRELREVKKIVENNGLKRGDKGFEIGIMCEIPANVFLADVFCQEGVDFFSIGSNDLTQLTLGVDRDSAIVAEEFDERDSAVLRAIRHVIKTCHLYGVKVSICGQAPSVHEEYTDFLIDAGIDSISVNPDAIDKVRGLMAQAEQSAAIRHSGMEFEEHD